MVGTVSLLAATLGAQGRPAPTRIQVADGIYLFRSAPYGDVGLDGNSIAIVSNDGLHTHTVCVSRARGVGVWHG